LMAYPRLVETETHTLTEHPGGLVGD
jgi:hypothetical protein